MPKHEVSLKLPEHTVINTDAELVVRSGGAILGRLLISKGGVDWWPANAQRRHYTMTWEKFRDVMERDGKPAG